MRTRAYLNWGRWVADCPNDGCTNALAVEPGQQTFACSAPPGCGATGTLTWPDVAAVEQRYAGKADSAASEVIGGDPAEQATQAVRK